MKKLLAVFCIASAVFADTQDERLAKAIAQALESGQFEPILDAMPAEAWARLAQEPANLYVVANAAAAASAEAGIDDVESWELVAERLRGAVDEIPEGASDSADAHAARGAAAICSLHVAMLSGENFDPAKWGKAADHFLAAHKQQAGKGEFLERAARTLATGGATGSDEGLNARARDVCNRGLKSYPNNPYFARARHTAELDRILAASKTRKSEGKRLLAAYLKDLDDGKFGTGTPRDTAHTRAVTFAKNNPKIGVRAKYHTETVNVGAIWLEIPKGTTWKKSGKRLRQYDSDGNVMRLVTTTAYKWDTNYYVEGKTFGGDNPKGLAFIGEVSVLSTVIKVTRRRKIHRTKLSKKLSRCVGFVIAGRDADDDFLCYRAYYYQSKVRKMTTYCVDILELIDAKKEDPEAKFAFSTIREKR